MCFMYVCVCVLVYIYWVSGLYLLYTSLLGTGDTQRDYIFIIYTSELSFSFRCRQDWTEPHFASFPVPMHLRTISIKLNMEVTARVAREEDGLGEDTGASNILIMCFLGWLVGAWIFVVFISILFLHDKCSVNKLLKCPIPSAAFLWILRCFMLLCSSLTPASCFHCVCSHTEHA